MIDKKLLSITLTLRLKQATKPLYSSKKATLIALGAIS